MNQLTTHNEPQTTNHEPQTTNHEPRIMQNKPNFQKSQMNVNLYNTTDYENKWQRTLGENKPNQSQFQTQRPDGVVSEFLLFTLFDIPNMIDAIRKNTLSTGSIARVLSKKRNVFRRILEKIMEV